MYAAVKYPFHTDQLEKLKNQDMIFKQLVKLTSARLAN